MFVTRTTLKLLDINIHTNWVTLYKNFISEHFFHTCSGCSTLSKQLPIVRMIFIAYRLNCCSRLNICWWRFAVAIFESTIKNITSIAISFKGIRGLKLLFLEILLFSRTCKFKYEIILHAKHNWRHMNKMLTGQ